MSDIDKSEWCTRVSVVSLVCSLFIVPPSSTYTYPDYLCETLPMSDILKAIFTPDRSARVTLPELRKRDLAVDTFFMSHEWVKIAAADHSPDVRYAQFITFDSEARKALLGTWEPLTMTSPVVQSASSQLHGRRSSMAVHGPMFVIGSSVDSS